MTSDEPTVGPRLVEVGCGGGVQLREVTCVQASQGNQPVLDELCESLEPLPTVQRSVPPLCFVHFLKKVIFVFTTFYGFPQSSNRQTEVKYPLNLLI